MTIQIQNINSLWGSLIVEECLRSSLHYFCISPGSRSTPLTVAIARNPEARWIICFDERTAAFHALGYARATGLPAAVITTSGTAVVNCFPAVIEAAMDNIPLLILSADRPPELRQTGANQTIHQPHIFGRYVKWEFDLPCPNQKISPRVVLTTVDQAVYQSRRSPAGPVHLNCMFREPLAPTSEPMDTSYLAELREWQSHDRPFTRYQAPEPKPDETSLQEVAKCINESRRGLLVVGRLDARADREAVTTLAEKLRWPVFPDIMSGLRLGISRCQVVHYFDQILLSGKTLTKSPPDTILHIGGQITSKRFLQFLENYKRGNYIVIKNHPFRHDPAHVVTLRVESAIGPFCETLLPLVHRRNGGEWLSILKALSRKVDQAIEKFLSDHNQIDEISTARLISRYLPEDGALFLASSMPIRDMDMYGVPDGVPVPVEANRGVSGIDGTIATAAGFAMGLTRRVTLIMGDLAFLHDLNSLSLLRSLDVPLTIVILNNRGGGIFSFLPIAAFNDVFEPFFSTPHKWTFEHAAKLFKLDYYLPHSQEEFLSAYQSSIKRRMSAIIEIQTERNANYELHRELQQRIISEIEQL